ncbi:MULTISPECIES: molybdopterin-dependent oxidoreductase [Halorussus]|uniref:molybdopterin-dependent oxidoreductase n=1 Tax=Halorussus TaxID=1070314 RepID=UPI000E215D77|nr:MULTISPECIES: molybdopterin-dependent oxidoreductase [Halorussus]NHN61579.1 molybdopterin-dependent oxidoreductase [Halorussus sp. JP-T4]
MNAATDEPTGVPTEDHERPPADRALPRTTARCTVECTSGERNTDEWTGVPLAELATAADFPGETTHLRVEAADFAADVPIRPALDGVLAFERRRGRDDGESGLPRLVADGVDGERFVKRVESITAVSLDPDEEPRVGASPE